MMMMVANPNWLNYRNCRHPRMVLVANFELLRLGVSREL
jgi:hypothetical protein